MIMFTKHRKRIAVLVYDGQAAARRAQETYQQRQLAKELYAAGMFVNKKPVVTQRVYIKHIFTGEFIAILESEVTKYENHGVTIYRF